MENSPANMLTQLTDTLVLSASSGAKLADKIQFAQYYSLLTQATADEEEPTPGYLLGEIKDIGYHSPFCIQLVDYLNRRLTKPSTTVKIKVLKIMIYLIHNGHVDVRKHLRKNDGPIKAALTYHGPPDVMIGNTAYETVHKLAEETLECLFNPDLVHQDEMGVESNSMNSTSSNYMGGLGSMLKTNSKYEGFGNSPREKECTVADKMRGYLGRFIQPSENQTNEVIRAALQSSPGDYQPVAVSGTFVEPQLTAQPVVKSTYVKSHVPGRAGGGWESDEDVTTETDVKISENALGSLQMDSQNESFDRTVSYVVPEEFSREGQQLVEDFCGNAAFPSVLELDDVCKRCSTLDRMDIVRTLTSVLSNSTCDKTRIRALLLAEWLLQQDPIVHHSLSRLLRESLELVLKTDKSSCSPAVMSKARKVQLMLNKWAAQCDPMQVTTKVT